MSLVKYIQEYPMRLIVMILGIHLVIGAAYSFTTLFLGVEPTDISTLTFGLGGVIYYTSYLLVCLVLGVALVVAEFFNIFWLEKISLMGYVAIRAYIIVTIIGTVGFFPLSWLPNLALLLIAATIRLSLRLKHQYE